ncbi:MAG TPA: hypothetical protein VGG46_00735 [Terriglobales bacterium]|jgi:hypothetical protein
MDKSIQININLHNLYIALGVLATALLISLIFRKTRKWFKRRYKELDLLGVYFTQAGLQWQALIWGSSVLALAFGWHFVTADWPYPVKVTACVVALFFAGYYVWREKYIRLVPRLELSPLVITSVPLDNPTQQFVLITAKCATDGTIKDCRGQLLKVLKWSVHKQDWDSTQISSTIDLLWSELDVPSVLLEPGAPRRLVIFSVEKNTWQIKVWDEKRSVRIPLSYSPKSVFRFDIRVGEPCFKPEFASIKIIFGQTWGDITCEEIKVSASDQSPNR